MRFSLFLATLFPVASQATELITFEANKPARAQEVNENFSRLDSAIQNRPTKADLGSTDALLKSALNSIGQLQTGKIDQNALDKQLAAKADTGAFADLARRQKADAESLNASLKGALTAGSLAGIRDSLKLKADSSALNAFQRRSEAALADFKSKVRQDSAATASALASVPTSSNLASKLDAAAFTAFQSKVKADSAAHRAAIAAKLDASGGTISGDLSVAKRLVVGSSVSAGGFQTGGEISAVRGKFDTLNSAGSIQAMYPDGLAGAIYGDKAGTPGKGNYSIAWQRDGSEVFLRAGGKYMYLREKENAPVYFDGATDRGVWHSGNLDPSAYVKTKGAVLEGNEANEITSVYNDNYTLEKQAGILASIRHALDFRWYDSHWQIGNIRSGSNPSLGFGISNGNSDLRVWVGETDTRIFGNLILPTGKLAAASGSLGDLRITGTLTTAPGATPADYVFEPDYKLAPLSEIEAFTKANKHLPEVPSASEMTTEGVDLAKMNMVLLKKVEELTLHAIAQEKRLDQQQKLIEGLLSERPNR